MRTKVKSLKKVLTKDLVLTTAFFFVIFFAPLIGSQAITGPLVNAMLFLSVVFLGLRNALWLSLFPSLVAVFTGIIPFAALPMIPFIITSNIILVLVFSFYQKSFWQGVFTASFAKFIFLFSTAHVLTGYFIGGNLAVQMTTIFGWHQLATALIGGVIAKIFIMIASNKTSS